MKIISDYKNNFRLRIFKEFHNFFFLLFIKNKDKKLKTNIPR
jgi:hypothetical protein